MKYYRRTFAGGLEESHGRDWDLCSSGIERIRIYPGMYVRIPQGRFRQVMPCKIKTTELIGETPVDRRTVAQIIVGVRRRIRQLAHA